MRRAAPKTGVSSKQTGQTGSKATEGGALPVLLSHYTHLIGCSALRIILDGLTGFLVVFNPLVKACCVFAPTSAKAELLSCIWLQYLRPSSL